jgi:SAM-dependent methyltransferase
LISIYRCPEMTDFNPRFGSPDPGALLRAGRGDDAARIYHQAAQANPRRPDAHNNLGVALKAGGRVKEAIESYRRAIKLDSAYATARNNLARALRETGKHEEALTHFAMVSRADPASADARAEIVETLVEMPFAKLSPPARKILLELFQRGDVDLQRLALPTLRLLMTNRRLSTAITAAVEAYPKGEPSAPPTPKDLADPLLIALLTWTIPPSRDVEAWITMARRYLLNAAMSGESSGHAIAADRGLLWAIAAQCHSSEHAAFASPDEQATAEALAKTVTADEEAKIAIVGMYLPLHQVAAARSLWERISIPGTKQTPMRLLLERAIAHPAIEQGLAEVLPHLTPIDNATSLAVRAQYEVNPYPKWLSTDREAKPRSLGERLRGRYATLSTGSGLDLETPSILVAGCGTGRHAITTAARYKDSSVRAVDISMASLGYAARQARAFGQTNITFAQADILGLGQIEERFDLIECSGVLHHMADPMAGWRVLRGLTKARGLMRIGLYSAHARQRWEALRAPIPQDADARAVAEFLRARRAGLLANPPSGPDALVLRIADFYSLSGCRDLLFHTSEVQFSLPETAAALDALDLDFLGFDALPTETTGAFRARFPQPEAERDLTAWDTFEGDNPDSFIAMYQFWCQARG